MNSIFLFFGISFATPALRQEIQELIQAKQCTKAVEKSEVWEDESSKAWQHWDLRAQALECAQAPIDRIYYAYRMYLWYGGKKTDAIKDRMAALYPSLFDLRVTIKPPSNLGVISPDTIQLHIAERKWAPFTKEKGTSNVYVASNLLPDSNTLHVSSPNPRIPSYSIPIQAAANTEFDVTVDWPKATIIVPKSDERISAKVYIPSEPDGKVYKTGDSISTIAGSISIEPILDNLGDIKVGTYDFGIPKGTSNLPLPWGYEVFYDNKLLKREVLPATKTAIARDDITIPLSFGIQTVQLPSTLNVSAQYGVIKKYNITSTSLPVGQAYNKISKAQSELKANLKPQLIAYGSALVLFFTSSKLESMAQNSALISRRTEEAEEYKSEVLKAKTFRTSSILTFGGGVVAFGWGAKISFGPVKTIIQNFVASQEEQKQIKQTVININEYLEE